jgi:hypothetical protein
MAFAAIDCAIDCTGSLPVGLAHDIAIRLEVRHCGL